MVTGASDYYWRVNAPARVVGARVIGIPEEKATETLCFPNDSKLLPWFMDDGEPGFGFPAHSGVAVWTRPDTPRAILADAMRALGYRQVAELDDNYMASGRHNIVLRAVGQSEETVLEHLRSLASMDAVAFTTPALRDMYWRAFKDHRLPRPEMHVCGNHLFLDDWPTVEEYDGPVRVGWMGSASHLWDVNTIRTAIHYATLTGCKTKMIGYHPAFPDMPPTTSRAVRLTELWQEAGAEHVPWKQLSGHERMDLGLDIGLCPLRFDPFTAGKSDIKAVEYTISGAAVIAQNHPVYNKSWVHGETALLCSSMDDFVGAVDLLRRDERLRLRLVANAQQYVREERDLAKHAGEWREFVYGTAVEQVA